VGPYPIRMWRIVTENRHLSVNFEVLFLWQTCIKHTLLSLFNRFILPLGKFCRRVLSSYCLSVCLSVCLSRFTRDRNKFWWHLIKFYLFFNFVYKIFTPLSVKIFSLSGGPLQNSILYWLFITLSMPGPNPPGPPLINICLSEWQKYFVWPEAMCKFQYFIHCS